MAANVSFLKKAFGKWLVTVYTERIKIQTKIATIWSPTRCVSAVFYVKRILIFKLELR